MVIPVHPKPSHHHILLKTPIITMLLSLVNFSVLSPPPECQQLCSVNDQTAICGESCFTLCEGVRNLSEHVAEESRFLKTCGSLGPLDMLLGLKKKMLSYMKKDKRHKSISEEKKNKIHEQFVPTGFH